jgi:hypothetical protein
MKTKKTLNLIILLTIIVTSNNSYKYIYINNQIKLISNTPSVALTLPPKNKIVEEIFMSIFKNRRHNLKRATTVIENLHSIFPYMSKKFLNSHAGKFVASKIADTLIMNICDQNNENILKILNAIGNNKSLLKLVLEYNGRENYNVLETVMNNVKLNANVFTRIINIIIDIYPNSELPWVYGLKIRNPNDPIRNLGEPYLDNLSQLFQTHFKQQNITIYSINERYENQLGVNLFVRKTNNNQIFVYMTKQLEKILTTYYWYVVRVCGDENQAKELIVSIIKARLNSNSEETKNFINSHPLIRLEIQEWLTNSENSHINQKLDTSLGESMLNAIYVAKRSYRNISITTKVKDIEQKLEPFAKQKLDEWKNSIRAIIQNQMNFFMQKLKCVFIETNTEWSYNELLKVGSALLSMPQETRDKAKVAKIGIIYEKNFPDDLKKSDAYSEDGRQTIQFLKNISGPNAIHEFAHLLQDSYAKPYFCIAWMLCVSKDSFFPCKFALNNWQEDMAETMLLYRFDPEKLKMICPHRYAFLKNIVFNGKEYQNDVIQEYKHKSVSWVISKQNVTLMKYFLSIGKTREEDLNDNNWINSNNKFANPLTAIAVKEGVESVSEIQHLFIPRSNFDRVFYGYKLQKYHITTKLLSLEDDYNITFPMLLVARANLTDFKNFFDTLTSEQRNIVLLNQGGNYKQNLLMQAVFNWTNDIVEFLASKITEQKLWHKILDQKSTNNHGNVIKIAKDINNMRAIQLILSSLKKSKNPEYKNILRMLKKTSTRHNIYWIIPITHIIGFVILNIGIISVFFITSLDLIIVTALITNGIMAILMCSLMKSIIAQDGYKMFVARLFFVEHIMDINKMISNTKMKKKLNTNTLIDIPKIVKICSA